MPRVGPVLLQRLQARFGTLKAAWSAEMEQLLLVEGLGEQTLGAVIVARDRLDPEGFWEQHQVLNPNFWTPADSDYPLPLLSIPSSPPVLYYRGRVDGAELSGQRPLVAIVGTRDPSAYGRRWARRLAALLTERGFTVVSGMADGIDTEAHQGALEAGGRTIAVLGTGVDVVYPSKNRELYRAICRDGVVLSEYPAGTGPQRAHFPQRNRIVAGLCQATLIIEAGKGSGALITAQLAQDFQRQVYVLAGSLDNPKARGCLDWLSKGATLIVDEGLLLEQLTAQMGEGVGGRSPSLSQAQLPLAFVAPTIPVDLDPELAAVLQVINDEPCSFDRIAGQAALSAPQVSSALLQLELQGLVVQLPGMLYQRS